MLTRVIRKCSRSGCALHLHVGLWVVWLQYFAKPLRCLEQRVEPNFICSWYITVCWFVFALGSSLRATGLSGEAVPSLCKLKLERVAPIQGFAVCGLRLKKNQTRRIWQPPIGAFPTRIRNASATWNPNAKRGLGNSGTGRQIYCKELSPVKPQHSPCKPIHAN